MWFESPAAGPALDEEVTYGTLLARIQMVRTSITVAEDTFVCDPVGERSVGRGVAGFISSCLFSGMDGDETRSVGTLRSLVRDPWRPPDPNPMSGTKRRRACSGR
jgi:hypothetical protein